MDHSCCFMLPSDHGRETRQVRCSQVRRLPGGYRLRSRGKVRHVRSKHARGAAMAAAALVLAAGCSGSTAAAGTPSLEKTNLTVAVVPALDSAGFFIALYQGLFAAQGLNVHFVPATSSETTIDQQALGTPGSKNEVDISGGNYVSYIQAQRNWNSGERPSASDPG